MTYYTQEEFVNGIKNAFKNEGFIDSWTRKALNHLGLKLTQKGEQMVLTIYEDKKRKSKTYEEFYISMVEVDEKDDFKYCDTFNVNTKSGDRHIQFEMDYGSTKDFLEILQGIMYYFYSRY